MMDQHDARRRITPTEARKLAELMSELQTTDYKSCLSLISQVFDFNPNLSGTPAYFTRAMLVVRQAQTNSEKSKEIIADAAIRRTFYREMAKQQVTAEDITLRPFLGGIAAIDIRLEDPETTIAPGRILSVAKALVEQSTPHSKLIPVVWEEDVKPRLSVLRAKHYSDQYGLYKVPTIALDTLIAAGISAPDCIRLLCSVPKGERELVSFPYTFNITSREDLPPS